MHSWLQKMCGCVYLRGSWPLFLSYQLLFQLTLILLGAGFPGGTSGKEPACHCRRHKRYRLDAWVGKISWRRAWQPTPVFLPGESPWTEEPGYSLWGHKESDTTERLSSVWSYTCSLPCLHFQWGRNYTSWYMRANCKSWFSGCVINP